MTKDGKEMFMRKLYQWASIRDMDKMSFKANWMHFFENEDDDIVSEAIDIYKLEHPLPPAVSEIREIVNSLKKKKSEAEEFERIAHDAPCQKCLGRGFWLEWWHDEWQTQPNGKKKHVVYQLDKPPLNEDGALTDQFASESMMPCGCSIGRSKFAGVWKELERKEAQSNARRNEE